MSDTNNAGLAAVSAEQVAALPADAKAAFVTSLERVHGAAAVAAHLEPKYPDLNKPVQIKADNLPYASEAEADAAAALGRANRQTAIAANITEYLATPGESERYELNYGDTARALEPGALKALDTEMQTVMRSMGATKLLAQPAVSAFLSSMRQTEHMSPVQKELVQRENLSIVGRLSNSKELVELSNTALAAIPEALRQSLFDKGALASVAGLIALSHIGRALSLREARKK